MARSTGPKAARSRNSDPPCLPTDFEPEAARAPGPRRPSTAHGIGRLDSPACRLCRGSGSPASSSDRTSVGQTEALAQDSDLY